MQKSLFIGLPQRYGVTITLGFITVPTSYGIISIGKICQHPEVSPHNTLCLFVHNSSRSGSQAVRNNVEDQNKLVAHLENKIKYLWYRMYSQKDKTNIMGNK